MHEAIHVSDDAIHVDLPSVRQQTKYSCGAASLRAVCKYFKVGNKNEREYMKKLGTDPDGGTAVIDIVKACQDWGLGVHAKQRMTVRELKSLVKKGIPVICAMQAWGTRRQYQKDQSGHYVVAIGFDDKHVYFMDPAMDNGVRGFLKDDVFLRRWHDEDKHGQTFPQLGIAIWKPEPEKETQDLHAVEKID